MKLSGKIKSHPFLLLLWIPFLVSLLRLIDLGSFHSIGLPVLGHCPPPLLPTFWQTVLFYAYSAFFTFLLFSVILAGWYLIGYRWLAALIGRAGLTHRRQRFVLGLWAAVIIYCAWTFGARLLIIPVLPDLLLIPLYLFLAIVLTMVYLWLRKTEETGNLFAATAAAVAALFIFRLLFYSADRTFLTPLTRKNFPAAAGALLVSAAAGLLIFFPLKRRFTSFAAGRNVPRFLRRALSWCLAFLLIFNLAGFLVEKMRSSPDSRTLASRSGLNVNVLFVLFDTLRADHLGCYGYERLTSPAVDALAREGVLFQNCYAQASWTKPSIASILTSLYPTMHGSQLTEDILPGELSTLPEVLRENGYVTCGITTNPVTKAVFNYHQGFDFFDDFLTRSRIFSVAVRHLPFAGAIRKLSGRYFDFRDGNRADSVVRRVLPWLRRHRDQNFFLYLHFMDTHTPYNMPEAYRELFSPATDDTDSRNLALYDGEIRFADDHLKKILDELDELGISDRTLVIVTSDHGEAFGEHGDRLHGHTIYQHQVRIPLILSGPGVPRGRTVAAAVRSIDIAPTILEILGIRSVPKSEGVSLLPLIEGESEIPSSEFVFIEERTWGNVYVLKGIIRNSRWKLILTEKSKFLEEGEEGKFELYDLAADPEELKDLIGEKPEIFEALKERFDWYTDYVERNRVHTERREQDADTLQQIKALGYI